MPAKSIQSKKVVLVRENPDGSGPSQSVEEKVLAVAAIYRVRKALTKLSRGVAAINRILGNLSMNANTAAIETDDENAPDIWGGHRQEFKETLLNVYDAIDQVSEMVKRTENHVNSEQFAMLVSSTRHLRENIYALLPQELHDSLVGKGKEVTRG